MLSTISGVCKSPLHYATRQLLGECLDRDLRKPPLEGWRETAQVVSSVVKVVFFTFALALSTPLWIIGDVVELLTPGNKPFKDPEIALEKVQCRLDPDRTKWMGFSISTYQNTSDRNFCTGSDWQKYSQEHFIGDKEHLAPGQGMDILNEERRGEIIGDLHAANANCLRFSVEWADILNPNGSFNDVTMQQYVNAAKDLANAGIMPIITLHHFVTPLDTDGRPLLEKPEGIDQFVSFAKYVYEHLSPYVEHFVTFNEASVNTVENYVLGDFPMGGKGNFWKQKRVTNYMLEAHKKVHKELHEMAKEREQEVQVGITHQALQFAPTSRWNYLARIVSFIFEECFHQSFMRWAEKNVDSIDWLGVQYYTKPLLGGFPPDSICRENEKMVKAMRFRFYPEGIFSVIQDIAKRTKFKVPLVVTETGTAGTSNVEHVDAMDKARCEYFDRSIKAVRKAQRVGYNVIGYLPWTLYGNFEWPHGFSKDTDFGVIARDPSTNKTRKTEAFTVIQNVFQECFEAQQDNIRKRRENSLQAI